MSGSAVRRPMALRRSSIRRNGSWQRTPTCSRTSISARAHDGPALDRPAWRQRSVERRRHPRFHGRLAVVLVTTREALVAEDTDDCSRALIRGPCSDVYARELATGRSSSSRPDRTATRTTTGSGLGHVGRRPVRVLHHGRAARRRGRGGQLARSTTASVRWAVSTSTSAISPAIPRS